jgi:hypothetical protein
MNALALNRLMAWRAERRERGTVLVTTLILALLVGLAVGALLKVGQQQNYMTARSKTWCSAIPIAEAGIEEAMAHLNSHPLKLSDNGWTISGSNVVKTRVIRDGYYYTAIRTNEPPTIISIGYARIPLQTNFTRRTVFVTTKMAPPVWGIIAKKSIAMNGSVAVDSFDSSNPDYSDPNGNYDPNETRDRAGVATLSTNAGAINTGGAVVYGSVATGPGGTSIGNVGDGEWISGGSSGIQPGHASDDFNMAIDDVILPTGLAGALPPKQLTLPAVVGLDVYPFALNGDYAALNGWTVGSGANLYITGKTRFYVKGPFRVSGTGKITIANGASLELYVDGDMDIAGGGIVNGTQVASACALYGLPGCTSLRYSGNAELHAKIYAPQATLEMVGTTDFSGSIVANSISFKGTPRIHYDEALGGAHPDYRIVLWQEL